MKNRQRKPSPGVYRVYGVLRYVLVPVVILALGFSAYQIIRTEKLYLESSDTYREMSEQFVASVSTVEPGVYSSEQETVQAAQREQENDGIPVPAFQTAYPTNVNGSVIPAETPATQDQDTDPERKRAPITVDFDSLRAMNGDSVGWIYIPETTVSYPVLQTGNNSWYLDHLPNGQTNSSGSVFMDYRCKNDMSDLNMILYGHRLNNGTMFAPLLQFRNLKYFNAHRIGYYLTPDTDYELNFIACMTVSASGESYDIFDNDAELRTYLSETVQKSGTSAPFTPSDVNRIMTLSTCTGSFGTRVVLIAILNPIV